MGARKKALLKFPGGVRDHGKMPWGGDATIIIQLQYCGHTVILCSPTTWPVLTILQPLSPLTLEGTYGMKLLSSSTFGEN